MLLPVKPICEAKNARRDGTSIIFIQYCHSAEKRTTLNTGIAIPAKYWVSKNLSISKFLPPTFGQPEELNERLKQMIRTVEDLIALADRGEVADKGAFVKGAFKPDLDVASLSSDIPTIGMTFKAKSLKGNDVYAQLDDFILSKQKKVSKATIAVFKILKEHLQAFETYRKKPITFLSFDYAFYESFVDFLTFEYVHARRKEKLYGLKVNSIGKTIKKLRAFIKDRVKRKIIAPIDLTDFKIPEEETDAIYLTNDEIRKIYATNLTLQPHLVEYRDLFVLACLTGLRFSDFSTLRSEDLRNNMLYKKQEKSDHWVVIPMRKMAQEIFTAHFKESLPKLTNAEFNRHIKTIGKLAGIDMLITFTSKKGNRSIAQTKPKFDWITTHTARRSFCTNEFLAGTPVKLIMKLSGHKTEADFYRYIRISPEEAAIKIQEIWLHRDEITASTLMKSA